MSSITAAECESLRHHLQYSNISADASPYTPDGFQALFEQVIAPNLTSGAETSAASSIAQGLAIVTPLSMTDIVPRAQLVIDVGDDTEVVSVVSVTGSTFTARFRSAHAAGTPIALQSGTARLRMLLHRADQAWTALQDPAVGATAGLASVDKGDVSWFQGGRVVKDRLAHYKSIVAQISSLVRVSPNWPSASAMTSTY